MHNTEFLRNLHAQVWACRSELGERWPTPDLLDSLRFAFTEAGEAMDAWLREKGGYARNNTDKAHNVHAELADCAMMLLTALGPDLVVIPLVFTADTLEDICFGTARAMNYSRIYPDKLARGVVIDTILSIAAYPGMDLEAKLGQRLERIRHKHGGGND